MAVCIASNLAKDIAGQPLLRGVSFKLERRERMTIAGRNGAGKTTLLRMLSGEAGIDGGELAIAKNVRVALHDQRPPGQRRGGAGGGREARDRQERRGGPARAAPAAPARGGAARLPAVGRYDGAGDR